MASKRSYNAWGLILIAVAIVASIILGRAINPFEAPFARIVFAGAFSGLGGAIGVILARFAGGMSPAPDKDRRP